MRELCPRSFAQCIAEIRHLRDLDVFSLEVLLSRFLDRIYDLQSRDFIVVVVSSSMLKQGAISNSAFVLEKF